VPDRLISRLHVRVPNELLSIGPHVFATQQAHIGQCIAMSSTPVLREIRNEVTLGADSHEEVTRIVSSPDRTWAVTAYVRSSDDTIYDT
jgi:hypothetical protein